MATDQKEKKVTYLGQVFESKGATALLIACALVFIYCASLLLFADWSTYEDPFSAKGSAELVGGATLIMLGFLFLIPLFHGEQVSARKTQGQVDASGFYPEQPVYYTGPLTMGEKTAAMYVGIDADKQLILTIGGGPFEAVSPEQVTAR